MSRSRIADDSAALLILSTNVAIASPVSIILTSASYAGHPSYPSRVACSRRSAVSSTRTSSLSGHARLLNAVATVTRASRSVAKVSIGTTSGYSRVSSTSPSSPTGCDSTQSCGSPASWSGRSLTVVLSSRMWRSKVWPSSVSRSLIARTRSRVASSRSTPERRKSRSAKLRTRSASSSSPVVRCSASSTTRRSYTSRSSERSVSRRCASTSAASACSRSAASGCTCCSRLPAAKALLRARAMSFQRSRSTLASRGRSVFSAAISSRAESSWSVVRVVSQADQASVPASAAGRVSGARSVTPRNYPSARRVVRCRLGVISASVCADSA